ncbi:GNAT family N-acetyltransferase [Staphylococcus simulans]|uniref:GNAT family N-acetyltransferase n=1 Tax=Staphylococcus simulans TaxID=1286 RepID=UPI000E67EE13|nr:GNAT family N-acetyltransferase [Staphylococcus simulans]RIN66586.1 GNAT family N-acetyltransferase [Staphylococcus simulans]
MRTVREATPADVVGIRDVATKAWYDTYLNIYAATTVNELLTAAYNEQHLLKRLKEQLFLVAEEGEIVGFANFINGSELFLSAHYIHPKAQRKGYGTALLEKGLEHFKGKYDAVYLEVDNQNEEGVEYYRQQGFEMVRAYNREVYGEVMDLALMKKAF